MRLEEPDVDIKILTSPRTVRSLPARNYKAYRLARQGQSAKAIVEES
jgi:hypothetical protein